MVEVATEERSALDPAFAGNMLLATFSEDVRALIEPHGEIVELKSGDRIAHKDASHSNFTSYNARHG